MEIKVIRASLTQEKAVAIIAEMVGIIGKVIGTGAYIEENCTDPEVAKTGRLMKEALSVFMAKTLEFLQEDADHEEEPAGEPQADDLKDPPLRGGFPAPTSNKVH